MAWKSNNNYNRWTSGYLQGTLDISGSQLMRGNTDIILESTPSSNLSVRSLFNKTFWGNVQGNIFYGNSISIGKSTNPNYTLDVKGNINFTGNIYKNGTLFNSTQWGNVQGNIFYGNNVSIGKSTNPNYQLDVSGNINFTKNIYQNGNLFSPSQWTTLGNIIYYNGNVSIGKTTNNYTLDVKGNINFSGNIYQNGNLFISNSGFNLIDTKDYSRKITWQYKDLSGNLNDRANIYSSALTDEFNLDLEREYVDKMNISYNGTKALVLSDNYSESTLVKNTLLYSEDHLRKCYEITTYPFFHKTIKLKVPISIYTYNYLLVSGSKASSISISEVDVSIFKNGVYTGTSLNYTFTPNKVFNYTLINYNTISSILQYAFTLDIEFTPDYEDATNEYSFHAFVYHSGSGAFAVSPGYTFQMNTDISGNTATNFTVDSPNGSDYEKYERLISYKVNDVPNSTLEVNDILGNELVCGNITCNNLTFSGDVSNIAWSSGWFSVSVGTTYEKFHNLNMDLDNPFQVVIYFSQSATPTGNGDVYDAQKEFFNNGNGQFYGAWINQMNKNSIVVRTGNNSVYYDPVLGGLTSGYFRIYLISPQKVAKGEKGQKGQTGNIEGAILSNNPQYDSGWFSVGLNTNFVITHNLNMDISAPLRYTVLFSTVANPVLDTDMIFDVAQNQLYSGSTFCMYSFNYNKNSFTIRTGSSAVAWRANTTNQSWTSGYYRVYVYDTSVIGRGIQGIQGPAGSVEGAITTNSAQYDSGWFSVSANTSFEKFHNLNLSISKPLKVVMLFSNVENPTIGSDNVVDITNQSINSGFDNGYTINYSYANYLTIRTGDINVAVYYNRTTNAYTAATSGYYRLFLYDSNVFIRGEQGISGSSSNNSYFYLDSLNNRLITGTNTTPQYSITATGFASISDRKIKSNIEDITNQSIDKIKPSKYFNQLTKKTEFGFIAQDIKDNFPDLVEEQFMDNEPIYTLNYQQFIPLLVYEVKKTKKDIRKLETEIDILKTDIEHLKGNIIN